jgi:hypothetical protein
MRGETNGQLLLCGGFLAVLVRNIADQLHDITDVRECLMDTWFTAFGGARSYLFSQISTRLFFSRPSAVSFEATGS